MISSYQSTRINYIMSSNDIGLYDFIKGKSLFSPNKHPNRKRSRSRSRAPREYDNTSTLPPSQNNEKLNPLFHKTISTTYQPQQLQINQSPVDAPKIQQTFAPVHQPYTPIQNNFNSIPQNTHPQPSYQNQANYIPVQRLNQEDKWMRWGETGSQVSHSSQNSNLWSGILSHSNSFESARVESSQCLQTLSVKITRQLSNIHTKIDVFNSRMAAVLNNQFRAVKEKVQAVLEAAFRESDKYIQEYMKLKEAALAGELHQMKGLLEKQMGKVETMKEELAKPQWRKVAGEILSTDLQHKLEELLQKSSTLEVGEWELGDLAGYRIKNIESELREIVRLKP